MEPWEHVETHRHMADTFQNLKEARVVGAWRARTGVWGWIRGSTIG